MLQAIRDRVTGIVAFLILGLLAIPFLFFGVDSYIRDVPQDSIAKIGDAEITLSEFQTEFSRYRAQLRAQQGEDYNELEASRPQARREFLESMIDQQLLINYAQELGLAISPNTIVEVIQNIPAFQIDGQFNRDIYRQRVQAVGQTPASFERDLMDDLLLRELPAAVSSSVIVSPADLERWLRVQLEARRISYIEIDNAPFVEPESITDEAIAAFYEDNQGQFMRPERVSVEYVELDTRDMADTMEIEEEVLEQRYEATKARFMTPERRRAAHILITETGEREADEARALAESIKQRLEQGESFADLAEEFSDDPGSAAQGGDLGWIEPGVMMPEFEQALYEMAVDEVAGPVETEFGWHLIKLVEIDPPRGQTFAQARDAIAENIREERADDLYLELSERLIDLVYADPSGLDAVASDLGLELKTAGPFSRFGAEGVLADPRVLEATFSDLVLIDRQASEPIELDRNHAVVVRVTDHQPAEPRPLDDVADEIRTRLAREAANEAAREYGESLLTQVETDGSLEQLAEVESLELEQREITRRSFELGGQLLEEVFQLPAPNDQEPVFELVPRNGGWALVRLESVVPGDPEAADESQRQSARRQIEFARSSAEVQGLVQWLRANTEVSVVEDRL
ncbi:MAG: SurA N-terminal domain-containing protein [Wenzhouxiangellaceae bacterium]|nr:SurA N-terminal domain-containing protein [Wenzhouxiangellaceae bacterium]